MSLRHVSKPICLSALLLAAAASVLAQRADRATVTGGVTDPTGKSIPAAVVKVRSDDTGLLTDLTTNEAGAYSSPSLVLGTYTITVESAVVNTAAHTRSLRVRGPGFP